jgi:hypothetical protein
MTPSKRFPVAVTLPLTSAREGLALKTMPTAFSTDSLEKVLLLIDIERLLTFMNSA